MSTPVQSAVVRAVRTRSALVRSRLFPYCLNPYAGCAHACVYCYARFATRVSHPHEPWGSYVDARINAPQVLERQLQRAEPATVYMSSVCDAWQPAEKVYRIARKCLELLACSGFPLFLHSKSTLIERDFDVLRGKANVTLGVTVTTLNAEQARLFEPGASPPSERLAVVRSARKQGLRTFVFAGPLLPGLSDRGEGLRELLHRIAETKPDFVYVDRLNRHAGIWRDIRAALAVCESGLIPQYQRILFKSDPTAYETELRHRVDDIATACGLRDRIRWCF